MESEKVMLAAFTALEGVHFYSAFLPSIFTIGTFVSDGQGAAFIREGELKATVAALALAAIVSQLVANPLPFVFTCATCGVMLWTYESALRSATVSRA